jgi:hypothetical protein
MGAIKFELLITDEKEAMLLHHFCHAERSRSAARFKLFENRFYLFAPFLSR